MKTLEKITMIFIVVFAVFVETILYGCVALLRSDKEPPLTMVRVQVIRIIPQTNVADYDTLTMSIDSYNSIQLGNYIGWKYVLIDTLRNDEK